MPAHTQHAITLALSGASGALYGQRMLLALERHPAISRIYFIASKTAAAIAQDELGVRGDGPLAARLLGRESAKVEECAEGDLWARPSSGSVKTLGMVVAPCSAGTLGAIANGISRNLISRAADVTLKERRKLILLLREAPYSLIQIENMRRVTEAGAIVYPASPTFYDKPADFTAAADQIAARMIDLLGLNPDPIKRWRSGE